MHTIDLDIGVNRAPVWTVRRAVAFTERLITAAAAVDIIRNQSTYRVVMKIIQLNKRLHTDNIRQRIRQDNDKWWQRIHSGPL